MNTPPTDLENRREQAVARLSEAYAHDQIDEETFEARVEAVERAASAEAIAAQLVGLDGAGDAPGLDSNGIDRLVAPASAGAAATALAPRHAETASAFPGAALAVIADPPERGSVVTVFGSAARDRAWAVPRRLRVLAVFSGVDLDLREARLGPGVTEIDIVSVFAGVHIVVPPGLPVQVDGSGILGAFDRRLADTVPGGADDEVAADAALPSLRIKGMAVLSGVEVEDRLPGESSRQARRRRNKARKALAGSATDRRLIGDGRR